MVRIDTTQENSPGHLVLKRDGQPVHVLCGADYFFPGLDDKNQTERAKEFQFLPFRDAISTRQL